MVSSDVYRTRTGTPDRSRPPAARMNRPPNPAGGEGGNGSRVWLRAPSVRAAVLTPNGLLAVSLLLSAVLVGLVTAALA